jgi:diadenosine tetraphosphate (Ap4A) HIT family hydrolase
MQKGPTMRTHTSQKRYIHHAFGLGVKECPFCTIKENEPREIHEETKHFYRVENIFGYDIWDGHAVEDHQMIVPKRHITSFTQMNDDEKAEYLQLQLNGEKEGYCVYIRGIDGPTKSVAHAHAHLIKLDTRRKITQYFFVRKPHLVLFRTTNK